LLGKNRFFDPWGDVYGSMSAWSAPEKFSSGGDKLDFYSGALSPGSELFMRSTAWVCGMLASNIFARSRRDRVAFSGEALKKRIAIGVYGGFI
jgi:hypothetical protein